MADTLAVDIKASITWLFQDAIELTTISDSSKLEYARSLADGTAVDQADRLWHDQRTLAVGANDDLDLTALTQSVFGGTITVGFAKVKVLLLVNTSTTAGDDLVIGGAGSGGNAWGGPFDGSQTAKVEAPADSTLVLVNRKSGWTVTAGTGDILRINNSGAGAVTYKIVLVGTSL